MLTPDDLTPEEAKAIIDAARIALEAIALVDNDEA